MIMADNRDSQTMTVGRFPSLQAAELAAGMLRTNGVPCEVGGGTLASVLPLTDTWTPIELIVPQECAARARERLGTESVCPTFRGRQREFWNLVGDIPVRCLKYLPKEDWLEKLSS